MSTVKRPNYSPVFHSKSWACVGQAYISICSNACSNFMPCLMFSSGIDIELVGVQVELNSNEVAAMAYIPNSGHAYSLTKYAYTQMTAAGTCTESNVQQPYNSTVYVSLNAAVANTADPDAAALQPIATQLYGHHFLAADSCLSLSPPHWVLLAEQWAHSFNTYYTYDPIIDKHELTCTSVQKRACNSHSHF